MQTHNAGWCVMDYFDTDIIQDSEFIDGFVKRVKRERKDSTPPVLDRFAVMQLTETPKHREDADIILITKPEKGLLDKKVR